MRHIIVNKWNHKWPTSQFVLKCIIHNCVKQHLGWITITCHCGLSNFTSKFASFNFIKYIFTGKSSTFLCVFLNIKWKLEVSKITNRCNYFISTWGNVVINVKGRYMMNKLQLIHVNIYFWPFFHRVRSDFSTHFWSIFCLIFLKYG